MSLGHCQACGSFASIKKDSGEYLCPTCRLIRRHPQEAPYHDEKHRAALDQQTDP